MRPVRSCVTAPFGPDQRLGGGAAPPPTITGGLNPTIYRPARSVNSKGSSKGGAKLGSPTVATMTSSSGPTEITSPGQRLARLCKRPSCLSRSNVEACPLAGSIESTTAVEGHSQTGRPKNAGVCAFADAQNARANAPVTAKVLSLLSTQDIGNQFLNIAPSFIERGRKRLPYSACKKSAVKGEVGDWEF